MNSHQVFPQDNYPKQIGLFPIPILAVRCLEKIILLAYDLFLQNRYSSSSGAKTTRPVKKVFFNNNVARMDGKTLEEYGSEILSKTQSLLSMPLNTSPELSLPNKVTGANQARPYVELFGNMTTKRSITITKVTSPTNPKPFFVSVKPRYH